MKKFNTKSTVISQLTVKDLTRRNDSLSAKFFDCERFEHRQYNYEALELPDGKVLQVTGHNTTVHHSQSFNVFIDSQLEGRDFDEEELEEFVSKKYPNAPTSEPETIWKMYLMQGGTPRKRALEFQDILEKTTAAYSCKFIHKVFYNDAAQQMAAVIATDTADGQCIANMVSLQLILDKAKYNPWDVEVHDCSHRSNRPTGYPDLPIEKVGEFCDSPEGIRFFSELHKRDEAELQALQAESAAFKAEQDKKFATGEQDMDPVTRERKAARLEQVLEAIKGSSELEVFRYRNDKEYMHSAKIRLTGIPSDGLVCDLRRNGFYVESDDPWVMDIDKSTEDCSHSATDRPHKLTEARL